MISVGEIEQRLRDRAEELGRQLLPNARREGHYLKVGSIDGEEGGSLVIEIGGAKQGTWRDYAGTEYGDMLDLIQAAQRLGGKGEAVAWAKGFLGLADDWSPKTQRPDPAELARRAEDARARAATRAARDADERAAKMRGARALFLNDKSGPVAGSAAEAYLQGRGLSAAPLGAWPGALRCNAEVYFKPERVKVPALMGAVYLADGTHVATHRVFLQRDPAGLWTKIAHPNAKMVLGPMGGGFIPINKGASGRAMGKMPEGEPIYVAEGIEKCLAIRMKRPAARIVCSVSLGNIGAIVFPPAAKRLVIVADRDEHPKAQDALERAIAAQQARGLKVELVVPPAPFKDIDEWMLAEAPGPLVDAPGLIGSAA